MREFSSPANSPPPPAGNTQPEQQGWLAWVEPLEGRLERASSGSAAAFLDPAPTQLSQLLGSEEARAHAWSQVRRHGVWRLSVVLNGCACDLHLMWPAGSPRALLSVWRQSTPTGDATTLAAQLGHELRTPLSGAISLTELVLRSELNERQRKLLDMAVHSGRQLLELINHSLDLAKLDAVALRLAPRPFALHDCLRDAIQPLLAQAHAKGVALQARVQPGVPHRLVADDLRLRQVLSNLVGNALKFTARGQVRVDVRRGAANGGVMKLVVAVTDTGAGLTPDQRRHLFKPYMQADEHVPRHHGGTGLGLVLAQRLVTLMGGGPIQVESCPGIGSCFRFEVSVQPAAESDGATASAP